jgi:hypothetical protein
MVPAITGFLVSNVAGRFADALLAGGTPLPRVRKTVQVGAEPPPRPAPPRPSPPRPRLMACDGLWCLRVWQPTGSAAALQGAGVCGPSERHAARRAPRRRRLCARAHTPGPPPQNPSPRRLSNRAPGRAVARPA